MHLAWQNMRQPGIEPGSTAWKAAMLTTIPLTLAFVKMPESFLLIMTCFLWFFNNNIKSHCRDQDSNLGYCGHNAGS